MEMDDEMTEQTITAPTPGAKAILLYKSSEPLAPEMQALLVESGYIPLRCDDLSDVRLMPLAATHIVSSAQMDMVTQAALEAVGESENATKQFGQRLPAKLLALMKAQTS